MILQRFIQCQLRFCNGSCRMEIRECRIEIRPSTGFPSVIQTTALSRPQNKHTVPFGPAYCNSVGALANSCHALLVIKLVERAELGRTGRRRRASLRRPLKGPCALPMSTSAPSRASLP